MRILLGLLLAALLTAPLSAAPTLEDYLPAGVSYDPNIPKPADIIGHEVGEWHVSHDKLVQYMHAVAEASDRIQIETTGYSHEKRPILLLTVSSPGNLNNIDSIREDHVALSSGNSNRSVDSMPAVIWLCYSVHGNEASGGNAALLAAYHLAAGRGAAMDDLLENTIILIDPCLNPDGFNRFAQWVNMYRGMVLNPASDNREHNEMWPGGRTNHYWFDLNRDWLLLAHPESRARIETYHRWKPNILTDFHEMGTNSTYFFQPGVPSRKNPLTPTKNVRLTEQIAAFHAEAFDEKKRLYYSEESFDDYYYGKGSTYPDGNGCIGILFEQASARGHVQESIHGDLTFPFAIDNQFITTLSTLEAGRRLRGELLEYQQEFFRDALRAGGKASSAGYVFGDPSDRGKTLAMLDLLLRHDIDVYELNKSQNVNGTQVGPGSGYFVPNRQAQHTLVRSVFEPVTEFPDSLFYDVSTWCLPMSMGVPYAPSSSSGRGREVTSLPSLSVPTPPPSSQGSYGYAFAWDEYYAPRLLGRLHQAGIRTKVATRPFTARTTNGTQHFGFGSIVIPTGLPGNDNPALEDLLRMGAEEDGVLVSPLVSGLTPSGVDLGSPSLRSLTAPNPLLVIGSGVSSYESGEVWHLLDQRFGIKVNLVEKTRLPNVNLDDYTHLLMVNGNYGSFSEDMVDRIKDWVRSGGILVASKSAVRWVNSVELVALENVDNDEASEEDETPQRIPYARAGADSGSRLTSGAIFEAHVDNTHPLGYGLHDKIAVFRNSNRYIEPVDNPYGNVVQYTSDPFLSGYVTDENLDKLRDSAVAISHRVGGGAVIALVDNPNFRGVWYGTNKLYLNALFFGSIINRTGE